MRNSRHPVGTSAYVTAVHLNTTRPLSTAVDYYLNESTARNVADLDAKAARLLHAAKGVLPIAEEGCQVILARSGDEERGGHTDALVATLDDLRDAIAALEE